MRFKRAAAIGIVIRVARPPGPSTSPASIAVYPMRICVNSGESTMIP